VGAGGNVGAVLAGFLFKSSSITYSQAFVYIGVAIACVAAIVALINFDKTTEIVPEVGSLETAEA
jgi:NNP family nitrate/nitrite transporter-like MFS transporter